MMRLFNAWLGSLGDHLSSGRRSADRVVVPVPESYASEEEEVDVFSPGVISTINDILAIFETGRVLSTAAYASLGVLADGAGFSYGIHQSTDKSGTLDAILLRYIDLGGSKSDGVSALLDRMVTNQTVGLPPIAYRESWPQWAKDAAHLLESLGADPIMRAAQDQIFDEQYWRPAVAQCASMCLELPLSYLVVYDTCVQSGQSGVARIRRLFGPVPPSSGGDEREWTKAYVKARRGWLASYPNAAVQRSVYRMDAVQAIIDDDNWTLEPPLTVRGIKVR